MNVKKAYKFRLYPTARQEAYFACAFGASRWVWNKMLSDREAEYKASGKGNMPTPASYKKEFSWLKEVDSLALCNVQMDLNQAYSNFFAKRAKHPKFKSRKDYKQSYRTNNQRDSIRLDSEKDLLKLPKIGWVKIKYHRSLPKNAIIKNVTVSKTATGKFYASINFDCDIQAPKTKEHELVVLGIDYSSTHLFVDSDGYIADMPHFYRQAQKRLRKAQRRLCRMKKHSKNYDKQKLKIAILHEKVANQRKDFLHKESKRIADTYDVVCVENLNMTGIARSLKLAKATYDNGFGEFRTMLAYKLQERGKKFVKADKFFTSSQLCNVCGYKNIEVKNVKVKEWTCPNCGKQHDRDLNAAINLRNYALS